MTPYKDDSTNTIYEMLFCDRLDLYRNSNIVGDVYPWRILFSDPPDEIALRKIILDETMDSRVAALTYSRLRENRTSIAEKELLGVIVEVGMEQGLDVLAAYRDGTARYINYTGSMIIWEAPDETSRELTDQLFLHSMNIVHQIGPWHKPRLQHPVSGNVRITFLVSDGLYFGEGPMNVLFNDAMAGPALSSATKLMQFLTQNAVLK